MPRLRIEPFDPAHLDDAASLLAERHRLLRGHEPSLDPRHEDPAAARSEIVALLAQSDAAGVAAIVDGRLAGYLIGIGRDETTWGPNVWVEAAGQAVREPDLIRDLYGAAAGRWLEAGRRNHHALVPAAEPALVDAWFRLDFGQQHVHGIRDVPEPGWEPAIPPDLLVRRAQRRDMPVLAELDLALPHHHALAPVFATKPRPTLESALAELEADFGDERYATFVAERAGRVIGTAVGCSIEQSSMHTGLARPVSAGFLGYAAVLPDARGTGAGRALGGTVLAWARDAGYAWVVTDWRSANLQASRAWSGLGFRPLFRRLHRTIL